MSAVLAAARPNLTGRENMPGTNPIPHNENLWKEARAYAEKREPLPLTIAVGFIIPAGYVIVAAAEA
jgi:hypothetical protein